MRQQFSFIRWMVLAASALAFACSDERPQLARLPGSATILAFGDSLTYGYGAHSDKSYPVLLAQLIDRTVISSGVPGELSEEGLERFELAVETHMPDLVILCHGGNDILQRKSMSNLKENIVAMIRYAKAEGIPVLLVGVPKPALFLSTAAVYDEIAVEERVVYEGGILADILNDNTLKKDGIHPNEKGNLRLAEALQAALQKAGAL